MDLLKDLSAVAGQQFETVEEARDFFIQKEFLERLGSTDIEFAIAFECLTGYEPKYAHAVDAFELLKGLHPHFNRSGYNLQNKLNQARYFFTSQITNPVAGEDRYAYRVMSTVKLIENRGFNIQHSNSYFVTKVLTAEGLSALDKYFNNETKHFTIIPNVEDVGMTMNEFIGNVILTIGQTDRLGSKSFTEAQKTDLLKYLNKYSSEEVESGHAEMPRAKEEVENIRKAYRSGVADAPSIIPAYKSLRRALENGESARAHNMCLVIKDYKAYLIKTGMTVK